MKKVTWPFALVLAVCILLFSPLTAGMELLFFIDAIGLDMFAMLLEAQILVMFGLAASKVKHVALYVHHWMMDRDVNYFIPRKEMLRAYPPMIIHAVPAMIALPIFISAMVFRASLDT